MAPSWMDQTANLNLKRLWLELRVSMTDAGKEIHECIWRH